MAAIKAPRQIVITGPESAGKTTLTLALARHFGAAVVPEYARTYLEHLGRPYREDDLLAIAQGQFLWERYTAAVSGSSFFFCDTSLEVIKVWSDYRYGRTHPWVTGQLAQQSVYLYLLCVPDIPWAYDPMRENPHDREELLAIYQRELHTLNAPVHLVTGLDPAGRLAGAIGRLMDSL